jgi:anti-sigma regulatory factor (Ser/Thr protein kinase)
MTAIADVPDLSTLVQTEQCQVTLPSRVHWIEPAVEFLRQKAVLCGACHQARSPKLVVALHEAVTNAIIHGNLGLSSELKERGDNAFAQALAARSADSSYAEREVEILVDYDGERCRWIITDQGAGFDVDRVMARAASDDPELLLSSGRGILIMRSFLDEVRYERGGRRLILTLERDSGTEKRRRDRVALNQPVRIAPIRPDGTVDWDKAYDAISKNLSEDGAAILQERLATTERVLIAIYFNDQPIYVPAEVRHVRALGSEVVELGCRFQTRSATTNPTPPRVVPPSAEEEAVHEAIAALIESRSCPPLLGDERRAQPRVVFTDRVQILTSSANAPLVGFARDLSKGGISFISTAPVPEHVTLVFTPHDGGPPLWVRSQVVRSSRVKDGFYDVGARFLNLEDR